MVVVVLAVTSVVAVVPHYKWLTNAGLAFSSASLFASSSALSFFAAASSAALRFSISCADHRDAPPELELELELDADADADGERTIDRAGRTAAGRSARDCGFEAAGLATAFALALAVLVPAIRRSIADGLVKDDADDEEEKEEEEDG